MSKISQNINLQQSQQLVMTPQLQQAIKMLQLSNVELAEFVDEELEKNPLLEKVKPEEGEAQEAPDAPEIKDEVQTEFDEAWTGNEAETPQKNTLNDFDAGTAAIGTGGNINFDENGTSFEERMSGHTTLRDHLMQQLAIAFGDPRDLMIGALLIDRLNEAGYLSQNTQELTEKLSCSSERLERILGTLKGFDPTGIFAADLPECLALQLEEKNTLDRPMRTLLENLNLLADHNFKELTKICGVNETYLHDMVDEIRELNPKPAGKFEHLVVQTAIPDVLMRRLPKNLGGGWRVELNSDTLPKVLVNQSYYTQVSSHATQKKDKEYLSEKLNAANWLVKAMDQRAQTILKTAGEIVEQQDAFFNYGIEFLKPLTLKNIAEEIEMHESTVSRVTTNKYIGTPRGIFELKFFFSTALPSDDGNMHSSEAIKAKIKGLIDAEDPKKILSDDKIVTLLKEQRIDIARRTIAKYREALHIPSSVQRRKLKKSQP